MHKSRARVQPAVEGLEDRKLPARVLPILTMNAFNAVSADVRNIMGALAKEQDFNQARADLASLSSKIPYGRQGLAATWQSRLDVYDRAIPGSGLAARTQMIRDLYQDANHGVDAREFRVTGRGSSVFRAPGRRVVPPQVVPSVDSVRIVNTTGTTSSPGFAIVVTARLKTATNPAPITKTIGAGSSALFDFGSATQATITLDIKRADGAQKPPPVNGFILNRPINGYRGASFTISVFAGFYSIGS